MGPPSARRSRDTQANLKRVRKTMFVPRSHLLTRPLTHVPLLSNGNTIVVRTVWSCLLVLSCDISVPGQLVGSAINFPDGNQDDIRLLEYVLAGLSVVTILAWTGRAGDYNSCLRLDLAVYDQFVPPHVP